MFFLELADCCIFLYYKFSNLHTIFTGYLGLITQSMFWQDNYQQHCAQCIAPLFQLLRGQFCVFCLARATCCIDGGVKFGVESRPSAVQGWGPPKWKINFSQFRNINASKKYISWAIFLQNLQSCGQIHNGLGIKIWVGSLKGLRSYGGVNLGGEICHKFSAPVSGETIRRIQICFKVQKGYGSPPSPYQVVGFNFACHCGRKVQCFFVSPLIDWMSWGFTSHPTQNKSFWRCSSSQSLGLVLKN